MLHNVKLSRTILQSIFSKHCCLCALGLTLAPLQISCIRYFNTNDVYQVTQTKVAAVLPKCYVL